MRLCQLNDSTLRPSGCVWFTADRSHDNVRNAYINDIPDAALELMVRMLRVNPALRLTAAQALQHRWFRGVRFTYGVNGSADVAGADGSSFCALVQQAEAHLGTRLLSAAARSKTHSRDDGSATAFETPAGCCHRPTAWR